jgi:predicted site-specific integrase-resolvase
MRRNTDLRLLTEHEVARFLAISVKTLAKWRRTGGGPVWHKIDNGARYRQADVDTFLKKTRQP